MNIFTSLDSLKRTALRKIVDNLGNKISSEHIYNFLNQYINYGNSAVSSLPSLVKPDLRNLYAADFSAKTMLAYLELYAQYVISSSMMETANELNSISLSKYFSILFKYKEASSLIEEKRSLRDNRYVRHINFSAPKSILPTTQDNKLFSISNTLQLSYQDVLSLPIMSKKIVYPDDIMVYINDNALGTLNYTSDNKNVSASILRKIGQHIGNIKEVKPTNIVSNALTAMSFGGVIGGYVSDVIYFNIVSIANEADGIYLVYKTSTNGQEWSYQSDVQIYSENTNYDIYVLNSIKSGATFNIVDSAALSGGETWALVLEYNSLPAPQCNMKLIFNSVIPLSNITFNDISEYDLEFSTMASVKREETGASENVSMSQNSIENIVMPNGICYSVDITGSQARHKLASDSNGNLRLKYDYDIADITANSNIFYKVGCIIFDKLQVDNITSISLSAEETILPPRQSEAISRANTSYSIITETKFGISEIPIIPTDYYTKNPSYINSGKHFVLEPIIFDDKIVRDMTSMKYNMKFRFLEDVGTILYRFNSYHAFPTGDAKFYITSQQASGNKINSNNILAVSTSGDIRSHYVYKGNVHVGNTLSINSTSITGTTTNWTITNNQTAYMFYKDYDGQIKLAIKLITSLENEKSVLTQFSGNIYGKVSMLSADESYISPYVTKYTLSCI
jgi:hypothetical protein